jgi:hypothetical protein
MAGLSSYVVFMWSKNAFNLFIYTDEDFCQQGVAVM